MMQGVTVNNPATRTTKYAVSYKLNGERRFEFAQLQSASVEEAEAALKKMHDQNDDRITDVKVSKAL
ncbi:hypothetical protein SAMN05444064_10531 [Pseudomonas syringae]|uniref:Uncharacterized protein n=1 Tax=Pseudomonas cannabina TaxID=86840 RepID=A0A3M3QD90_PSECA|nr:hypothetical protein [Pseudomonas cannabina]SDW59842.1 hypothetical protein SAMN05444514_10531 [Pseudomonas syringae]KPW20341.1 Uncharacterized protein ALO83_01483 [Pseudomonas cannabina pv. alisalensis]RMN81913.1 hypothetical protein ALQ53_03147 [Pseudomonas cannabina]RMN85647.1 hypothetical protein ALQ52_00275 [Pseudomonas cannabina pv. alisalensis]RMN86998.1 hypothetical protein ALQ51_01184 [Pseudomonas cannabina]